jgi:hypothetical protein
MSYVRVSVSLQKVAAIGNRFIASVIVLLAV